MERGGRFRFAALFLSRIFAIMIKKIVFAALAVAMLACDSKPADPPALVPAPVDMAMLPEAGMKRGDLGSVWTPDTVLAAVCRAFADDVPGVSIVDGRDRAAVRVYLCDTVAVRRRLWP